MQRLQVEAGSMLKMVFILCIVLYVFLLIFLGSRNTKRVAAKVIGGATKVLLHLCKVILVTAINTAILIVNIAFSFGRPNALADAWVHYVERESDLIFGN